VVRRAAGRGICMPKRMTKHGRSSLARQGKEEGCNGSRILGASTIPVYAFVTPVLHSMLRDLRTKDASNSMPAKPRHFCYPP
jgi:hypothetical protein